MDDHHRRSVHLSKSDWYVVSLYLFCTLSSCSDKTKVWPIYSSVQFKKALLALKFTCKTLWPKLFTKKNKNKLKK